MARTNGVSTVAAVCAAVWLSDFARAQAIERVSVSSAGVEADGPSESPRLSADGRFVAFRSSATNLVANDNNAAADIFVRDRVLGTTERVSLKTNGQQGSAAFGREPRISGDGRYVFFVANGLDPADVSPNDDIYVRDRASGTTLWVTGPGYTATPWWFDVSADGRRVIYDNSVSFATPSLAIRDILSGQTWALNGVQGTPTSDSHAYSDGCLSGDGRFAFYRDMTFRVNGTSASNFERLELATGAVRSVRTGDSSVAPLSASFSGRHLLYTEFGFGLQSGNTRLYRLDTQTFEELRMDLRSLPAPPFGFQGMGVRSASISDDGAAVAFSSDDSTILPGDPNSWHNAFVRVADQRGTLRLDFDAAGLDTDGETGGVALSGDGRVIAFDSAATTLVANDLNATTDIFVRSVCGPHFVDLDGDGFGDPSSTPVQQCLPAPPNWSVSALDCDDANAQVHPGRIEVCDGLDQDCDSFVDEEANGATYCALNYAAFDCTPSMLSLGCPSASATSGVQLLASELDPQRACSFFYGLGPALVPWGSSGMGWMCVAAPRQRTAVLHSGGVNACEGTMSLDLWAWMSSHPGVLGTPFTPGQQLFVQGWFRKPNSPQGTVMTNAWTFVVAP